MAHVLDFFSAGCPACARFLEDVQLGKCGPCRLRVRDMRDLRTGRLARRYGVRVVPTLVIDGRIKVEGPIDEPWMCGDDFYEMLAARYPLAKPRGKSPPIGARTGRPNARLGRPPPGPRHRTPR